MIDYMKKMCQAFGAGALGALIYCLVFSIVVESGFMRHFGIEGGFRPANLTVALWGTYRNWFYETIVLYATFGFAYMLPWMKTPQAQRGLIYALLPAVFQLLYTMPTEGLGLFGINAGGFTFLFVLIFHAIWGLVAVSFAPNP